MPETDIADPHLPGLIRRLGLPAMVGLSMNACNQAVDAIFIGRLGAESLATLVLLAPLAGLVAAAGIGLGVGTASGIARTLGRGQTEEARRISGVAFVAAGVLALAATGGLLVGRDFILAVLDAPSPIRQAARPYLVPLSLCLGLSMVQILCDFTAMGRGNSRFSLQTLVLCFGVNMALNPVFIFAFGLGLQGSAWATLTAQIVTMAVWYVHFRNPLRRPMLGPLRLIRPVLAIGLPEAGAVAATTLAILLLMRIAGSTGDLLTVAAFGTALRLLFLVMLPLEGFAIGVQPILAHAFGAGDLDRVRRTLRWMLGMGFGATGGLMALFLLVPGPIAWLFTGSADLAEAVAHNLRWLAPALPAIVLRVIVQICLQAAFRPAAAALLGLAPMGWMLLPALAITTTLAEEAGLPLAVSLSTTSAALLAIALLRPLLIKPVPIGVSA